MQSFILAIFPRKPYTLWLNGRYFLSLLERSFPLFIQLYYFTIYKTAKAEH